MQEKFIIEAIGAVRCKRYTDCMHGLEQLMRVTSSFDINFIEYISSTLIRCARVYQLWHHVIAQTVESQAGLEETLIGVRRSTFECQVVSTYNAMYATISIMITTERRWLQTNKMKKKEEGCLQKRPILSSPPSLRRTQKMYAPTPR